ncbi:hypothetical protein GCM10018965_052430 [Nonomuraea roseola]
MGEPYAKRGRRATGDRSLPEPAARQLGQGTAAPTTHAPVRLRRAFRPALGMRGAGARQGHLRDHLDQIWMIM